MVLRELIAHNLNVSPEFINEAVDLAFRSVKKFNLPKKNEGYRVISQPDSKIKTIQYWLIHNVFNKLPVHESAMAYKKGTSILNNAIAHSKKSYFLKVDLKDFFPSLKFTDLDPIISQWHKKTKSEWEYNDSAKEIIRRCCFDKKGCLPIGYPSSPSISNALMYSFDINLIKKLSDKDAYGDVTYTRYADDIIISTNKKNVCNKLLIIALDVINKSKSPKITVNKEKIHFGSSTGGSAVVTGLRVCSNEHITIHRSQKDHIRLLLSLLAKDKLDKQDYESLRGHLAYVMHVDPCFYTKLQIKYLHAIEKLTFKDTISQ